jgi:hypothetical protein
VVNFAQTGTRSQLIGSKWEPVSCDRPRMEARARPIVVKLFVASVLALGTVLAADLLMAFIGR